MQRNDLKIGMNVAINPREDRTREVRVTGEITELLTNANSHPHGILVKLKNGEIGRVKEILGNDNKFVETKNHEDTAIVSVEDIILKGENHFVEFKSSMLWSERLTPEQVKKTSSPYVQQYERSASKVIIATSVAGFLNADGGDLLIGIKENKDTNKDELIGIESEYAKLKDPCEDGYRRKILDTIIKPFFPSFIFNHFNDYLKIEFHNIDNKTVCRIHANKSDEKVFLRINKVDIFYVRVDASTRKLQGEEIVNYCMKRFG